MKKNYNILLSLLLLLVLRPSLFSHVPIGAIKGLWNPIKKEYKRVSPLGGAIWWHSGIIKNIYSFGDNGSLKLTKATKLVKALFNEVPGHFSVTKNEAFPAYHFSPNLVGKLILTIEQFIDHGLTKISSGEKSILKNLIIKDQDFLESLKRKDATPSNETFNLSQNEIKKKIEKKNRDPEVLNNKRLLPLTLMNNTYDLIDGIAQAYEASHYNRTSPDHTTSTYLFKNCLHTILLAFLYEKSNSKQDLLDYFDAKIEKKRNDKNEIISFTSYLHEIITPDSYTPETFSTFLKRYQKTIDLEEAIEITPQSMLKNNDFEAYAYTLIMKKFILLPFLKPTPYKEATIKQLTTDKIGFSVTYSDCMETTLREITDNIFFSSLSQSFDVDEKIVEHEKTIEKDLKELKEYGKEPLKEKEKIITMKWNLAPSLVQFYKQHSSIEARGIQSAHSNWASLISNRTLFVYNRLINKKASSTIKAIAPENTQGFVMLNDKQLKELNKLKVKKIRGVRTRKLKIRGINEELNLLDVNGRKYICIPLKSDYFAYELQPSIRNLITFLHTFFGLSLFQPTLDQTLLNKKFNTSFLKNVFFKIGIERVEILGKIKIDIADYTNKEIALNTTKERGSLEILLSRGHGQIETNNEKANSKCDFTAKEPNSKASTITKYLIQKESFSFQDNLLLALNQVPYEEMINNDFIKHLNHDPLEQLLLYLDLSDKTKRAESIHTLFAKETFSKLSEKKEKTIVKLFWSKLVESLIFVEGRLQSEIAFGLATSKQPILNEILAKESNPEIFAPTNNSFLTLALSYFDATQEMETQKPPSWSKNIELLFDGAYKSNSLFITKLTEQLLYIFIEQKNKSAIDLANFFIEDGLRKGAPHTKIITAIYAYYHLIKTGEKSFEAKKHFNFLKSLAQKPLSSIENEMIGSLVFKLFTILTETEAFSKRKKMFIKPIIKAIEKNLDLQAIHSFIPIAQLITTLLQKRNLLTKNQIERLPNFIKKIWGNYTPNYALVTLPSKLLPIIKILQEKGYLKEVDYPTICGILHTYFLENPFGSSEKALALLKKFFSQPNFTKKSLSAIISILYASRFSHRTFRASNKQRVHLETLLNLLTKLHKQNLFQPQKENKYEETLFHEIIEILEEIVTMPELCNETVTNLLLTLSQGQLSNESVNIIINILAKFHDAPLKTRTSHHLVRILGILNKKNRIKRPHHQSSILRVLLSVWDERFKSTQDEALELFESLIDKGQLFSILYEHNHLTLLQLFSLISTKEHLKKTRALFVKLKKIIPKNLQEKIEKKLKIETQY